MCEPATFSVATAHSALYKILYYSPCSCEFVAAACGIELDDVSQHRSSRRGGTPTCARGDLLRVEVERHSPVEKQVRGMIKEGINVTGYLASLSKCVTCCRRV